MPGQDCGLRFAAFDQRSHRSTIIGRPREQTKAGKSRSEEHTSELQSPCNLVCRLLLEKKNNALVAHMEDVYQLIRAEQRVTADVPDAEIAADILSLPDHLRPVPIVVLIDQVAELALHT